MLYEQGILKRAGLLTGARDTFFRVGAFFFSLVT